MCRQFLFYVKTKSPTEFHDAMNLEIDMLVRRAALEWLDEAKRIYPGGRIQIGPKKANTKFSVHLPNRRDLTTYAFSPTGQGIWKPSVMDACLSLVSSPDKRKKYDDKFDEELGIINYEFSGDGKFDRSLRLALEHKLPMLYFRGIKPALYIAEVVVAIDEAPGLGGVMLSMLPEDELSSAQNVQNGDNESFLRVVKEIFEGPKIELSRSETRSAQRRLGQEDFRRSIMHAYKAHCAVCRFREEPLLEAAHIIPYSKDGPSEVPNGLSLCKIHHGAYDQNIVGIDADYIIHINQDMLKKKDGPMLEHGFQERDEEKIFVPRYVKDRPDKESLDQRFEEFSETS